MSNVNLSTGLPQDQTGDKPYLQFGNQFQTSGIHSSLFNNVDFNTMMWPQSLLTQALANGTIAPVIPNPLVGYRIQLPDGSATTPALGWTEAAESASGLYRIGANDYGYEVAGSLVTEWKAAEFRVNYLTPGSVVFAGTSGKLEQDNASFFWNDTSNFLKLESSLGKQIRLQYDSTTWSDFTVDINGNLYSTLTTGPQWIFKAFSPLFNITGTATNQAVTFRLVDNDTTLKSQLYYAGDAAAGSKATILQNYGGDYLQFQSNGSIRFTDKFAGTEYVRFLGNGDVSFGTGSFYWDNANSRLGIGIATPAAPLEVNGTPDVNGMYAYFGSGASSTTGIAIDAASTFVRDIRFQTIGSNRWVVRCDATAEAGANAGSNFVFLARDDSGASLFTDVFRMTRATGFSGFNTANPRRRLDLLDSANPQLRLTTADNSTFTDFQDSAGILTISPSANSIVFSNGTKTSTSGTTIGLSYTETFADGGTNSTTVANGLKLAPTINYTAASKTGKAVVLYFAPVLTSQPSGRNGGIVFSSVFTSSTFPSMRWFNTADEDTNPEWFEAGWHVTANLFVLKPNFAGTGTGRAWALRASDGSNGVVVPSGNTGSLDLGPTGSTSGVRTNGAVRIGTGLTTTATSGTELGISMTETIGPSSTSTLVAKLLNIVNTVNFSAGTPGAGKVNLVYLNPTLTAQPTGQNGGIVFGSTLNSSTFPAVRWHNQTDEDTNYEDVRAAFLSNVWTLGSYKGGTGTLRGIQIGVSGNSLGFYGTTPAAQGTGGQNVTNSVTDSGSTSGTIPDITDGVTYANDYTNLRRALFQLARMLKQDHDQLRAMGILT